MQRQPTEHFTLETALSLTTWTGMITSVLAYTVEYISMCNPSGPKYLLLMYSNHHLKPALNHWTDVKYAIIVCFTCDSSIIEFQSFT